MATQLADPPPELAQEPAEPDRAAPVPQPAGGACEKCGARMAPGQDWCLQCGAGARGSVTAGRWRGLAGVLAATTLLVLGAAAAGYAALSKKTRHAAIVTQTVAEAPPPAVATTPLPTTPSTPVTPLAKPPKIPLSASTPTPANTTPTTPATTPSTTTTPPSTTNTGGSNAAEEEQPEALLLDTNAAATYNPYGYPAEWFGDPSLAIDGDNTTGWSAQVNPASAPKLAEGLAIDLKSSHRLAAVKLVTSTPGMNVQVYGSAAKTLPVSITDPAWVPISHLVVVKKRHARIRLRNQKQTYRWVVLWISRAPASSVGTAQAPGKVAIDELELLPAK